MTRYSFDTASYTDVGSREVNEDSFGIFENGENRCFVLCDGLGGHGMGDEASALVTGVFERIYREKGNDPDFLNTAFLTAQEELLRAQEERGATKKMKTTCVAGVSDEKKLSIGYVGDSRLYVFRRNKVALRTQDHSVPQMLVVSGEISEKEIRNHPDRNILLRVLGVQWDSPQMDLLRPIPLRKIQALLLCSDGFWELIDEDQMCAMLRESKTAQEWLDKMKEAVLSNKEERNMDNNTAIAVFVR